MRIVPENTDEVVLGELGERLRAKRLELNLRQADLARDAGVNPKVIARLEAGQSVNSASLIRILRSLDLFEGLEHLIPASGPTPIEAVKETKGPRRRARPSKRSASPLKHSKRAWKWGDE